MALTDDQATTTLREFLAFLDAAGQPITIDRPAARAALDAIDAFVASNAAALNAAIPQPARGALSTLQKAALLAFVAMRRAGR